MKTKAEIAKERLEGTVGTLADGTGFATHPDALVLITPPVDPAFQICRSDGSTLVTIYQNTGKIEFGENYTLNEAAKTFWQAISGTCPQRALADIRKLVDPSVGQGCEIGEELAEEIRAILDRADGTDSGS